MSKNKQVQKTEAQLLTEFICQRIAQKNDEVLIESYWKLPRWKAIFQKQVIKATAFLKVYSYQAIIKALSTKEGVKIYSFYYPRLPELCAIEQEKIDKLNDRIAKSRPQTQEQEIKIEQESKKTFGRKSKIDKLRD